MPEPGGIATIVRYRWFILAGWLLAAALLLPASCQVGQYLDVTARVPGSESAAVDDALRLRFASPFGTWAALVVTGLPSPTEARGREILRLIADSMAHAAGVRRIWSWLDSQDSTLLGRQGGSLLVVGLDPGSGPAEGLIAPLRRASERLQHGLRPQYPNVNLRWTGSAPISYDLRRTSSADVAAAEARALPVTGGLLLLAFGTVGAAMLPILAGVLAIAMTLGLTVLLARFGHPSILLVNVVTMIGLGLGIDYALLIVSRFREAIAAGQDRAQAATEVARLGGHTIVVSGLAVLIGFGALLGIELTELRSVAAGGIAVTLFSILIAATLLPALLSWLGPRIESGRIWSRGGAAPSRRWETWGNYVARYPWRVLGGAGLPVLALALQTLRLRTDVEASSWLPPGMESAQGLAELRAMGRSAVVASMPVIVDLPAGVRPFSEVGWNGIRRLGAWLGSQPGIARVQSLAAQTEEWEPSIPLFVSAAARRTFVSRDRAAVALYVFPDEHADRHQLSRLVSELRAADVGALTGMPAARIRIGGVPAFHVDYGTAVKSRFGRVVAMAIGGTLLALFAGFRSVLIPLKAVALNLLSVVAALGALVIVFQDGHGVRWLGLDRNVEGVFSSVPLLVFCVVFGLSMDYEVFLVARIREAHWRGSDERAGLIEGLSRTAGVITSAAAIMVTVFAAFALGQFVLVKMLGVALAVAVALDATIVRLAIGPALLSIAGRWNWWPAAPPSDRRSS
jgi:RND superfamily putative drug exporter